MCASYLSNMSLEFVSVLFTWVLLCLESTTWAVDPADFMDRQAPLFDEFQLKESRDFASSTVFLPVLATGNMGHDLNDANCVTTSFVKTLKLSSNDSIIIAAGNDRRLAKHGKVAMAPDMAAMVAVKIVTSFRDKKQRPPNVTLVYINKADDEAIAKLQNNSERLYTRVSHPAVHSVVHHWPDRNTPGLHWKAGARYTGEAFAKFASKSERVEVLIGYAYVRGFSWLHVAGDAETMGVMTPLRKAKPTRVDIVRLHFFNMVTAENRERRTFCFNEQGDFGLNPAIIKAFGTTPADELDVEAPERGLHVILSRPNAATRTSSKEYAATSSVSRLVASTVAVALIVLIQLL